MWGEKAVFNMPYVAAVVPFKYGDILEQTANPITFARKAIYRKQVGVLIEVTWIHSQQTSLEFPGGFHKVGSIYTEGK